VARALNDAPETATSHVGPDGLGHQRHNRTGPQVDAVELLIGWIFPGCGNSARFRTERKGCTEAGIKVTLAECRLKGLEGGLSRAMAGRPVVQGANDLLDLRVCALIVVAASPILLMSGCEQPTMMTVRGIAGRDSSRNSRVPGLSGTREIRWECVVSRTGHSIG
jgi:hypothetical protein